MFMPSFVFYWQKTQESPGSWHKCLWGFCCLCAISHPHLLGLCTTLTRPWGFGDTVTAPGRDCLKSSANHIRQFQTMIWPSCVTLPLWSDSTNTLWNGTGFVSWTIRELTKSCWKDMHRLTRERECDGSTRSHPNHDHVNQDFTKSISESWTDSCIQSHSLELSDLINGSDWLQI